MPKEAFKRIILEWFIEQRGHGGPYVGDIEEDDRYVTLDGDFDLDDLAEKIASEVTVKVVCGFFA